MRTKDNLNAIGDAALLMQYLQGLGGAPAWQCQVLRTHLYDQTGREFA